MHANVLFLILFILENSASTYSMILLATRATPKEPYTGFIITLRPRHHQKLSRIKFRASSTPLRRKPVQRSHHQSGEKMRNLVTTQPFQTSTTAPLSETTTQWWPSGVRLGPRTERPYLPLHVLDPKSYKWNRKFPKIWFRTSATRFTYAPDVVNYPITFNWSVPRHLRVDKYTAKPDWPLDSPLFGSNQVYDYLEDVTLPTPLLSGETEYPITSPEPWWTYPPWWERKIADEKVNGTTKRPKHPTYFGKAKTTSRSTEPPAIVTIQLNKAYTERTSQSVTTSEPLTRSTILTTLKKSTPAAILATLTKTTHQTTLKNQIFIPTTRLFTEPLPKKNVIHHEGPWWRLTIVEHLNSSSSHFGTPGNTEKKRVKRFSQKRKPLVRQNAFRRKWRQICHLKNQSQFSNQSQAKQFYSTETKFLRKNRTRSASKDQLVRNRIASNKNKSSSLKSLLERILRSALDEFKEQILQGAFVNWEGVPEGQKSHKKEVKIRKHLSMLYKMFFSTLNEFVPKRNEAFLLDVVSREIGGDILSGVLKKTKALRLYLETENYKASGFGNVEKQSYIKDLAKPKVIKLFELFCKYNLIGKSGKKKAQTIFESLVLTVPKDLYQSKLVSNSIYSQNKVIQQFKYFPKEKIGPEVKTVMKRGKRENNVIDLNESSFNWSSQSMEKVVDEIVNELPMKTIQTGIKTDLITNKLQKLGKTNVNEDVISKMVKLDAENDGSKFDQATLDSVRIVIQQLLNEVLSTLRQNSWMKETMIKCFEEGYSVDSVVEAVVNQLSIESLIESIQREKVNITQIQRQRILNEFKDYKPMLSKMLKQEVELWENELSENSTINRQKRSMSMGGKDIFFLSANTGEQNEQEKMNVLQPAFRNKRENDEGNLSIRLRGEQEEEIEYDENQLNIEKEISALEKSPLSKSEKIIKMKKHLKWLQSQTENPADITFPDNFEDELMMTENYDEESTQAPRRSPKIRYQWKVRTKKPTVKVITFLPRIRINRGKPFIPLTTTELPLELPHTLPPTQRMRSKKPLQKLSQKVGVGSGDKTSIRKASKKQFRLDYTSKPLFLSGSGRSRPLQRLLTQKTTEEPARTFATVRTYQTMKFGKKTQQPVISLQEFLKRRNEFRRVREEVMWNKNFLTSSAAGGDKDKDTMQRDLSEEEGELSEDEVQLSFDTKLSGEIKAEDFTLRPLSDFLFTRPTPTSDLKETNTENSLSERHMTKKPSVNKLATKTKSAKGTRKKYTKKTGYTKSPNIKRNNKGVTTKISKRGQTVEKPISPNDCTAKRAKEETRNTDEGPRTDLDGERSKRDLSTLYSLRPLTSTSKDNTKVEMETNHWRFTDEPLLGSKPNITGQEVEQKSPSKKNGWPYRVELPVDSPSRANSSSNSFETYQQEHKKWFGEQRRGSPVNNYDIDWNQMRRKLEIQEISVWQKNKEKSRRKQTFDGRQLRNSWNVKYFKNISTTRTISPLSLKPTELPAFDASHVAEVWFNNSYKDEDFNFESKPQFTNFAPNELDHYKDTVFRGGFEPFVKTDKNGKTAFGRLHQEPRKRHYRIHDNRDPFFDEEEIKKLVNKTYDTDFRIKTHRKTHWHNRTFDPHYIFTQFITVQNPSKKRFVLHDFGKKQFEKLNSTELKNIYSQANSSQTVDPDFNKYLKILREHQVMSLRPKHYSFRDQENNTVVINQENDTFILQRSRRVPWDNKTDLEVYKTYRRSRKRFYNKTIDIIFSYYIFHKFKCGNMTRDVGYGRMSNVVNRWYNRTFVPKYRPDMFYIQNRLKRGKEFNVYKNEFNVLHSMMSEGNFDPDRWLHLMSVDNESKSKKEDKENVKNRGKTVDEFDKSSVQSSDHRSWEFINSNKKHGNIDYSTTSFNRSGSAIWKESPRLGMTTSPNTTAPSMKLGKSSFFQSMKEKGYSFFKTLFTKQDSEESEEV